eukprot:CAMPEP_0116141832 /NCGR_PEP_ID=MMETSP0329-20121206/14585_1 /TAXON_ID=697910 /ORGANISM="Pseudo-nitzschia arenysensis, Strain B593" /LENGTH=580 /DNA_ID=CAMNT_0003637027 /DNA_START=73 /DNA_END=1811 /DNA_ORIENTATION=-
MNEKRLNASKKSNIKFSALEMTDHFADSDHSHDEFNYRPQVRTEDDVDATLIATPASPATNSIGGDPHAHGLGGDLKSAVLGIVKGMVGPAILYLPHGFAQAGWAVAVPMLFASTALYLASSASLLECWEIETRNNKRLMQMEGTGGNNIEMSELRRNNGRNSPPISGNSTVEEFGDEFLEGSLVANAAEPTTQVTHVSTSVVTTPSYPGLAKKAFGKRGQTIVEIGIAAMQSGVCLTYLIFVPRNMSAFWGELLQREVSTTLILFLMVLVQIPLSWIREIRHLTVTNALANSLIMYGLILCVIFAFEEAVDPALDEEQAEDGEQRGPTAELFYKFFHLKPFNSSGWFLFIGTSVLLFEGSITLLIPLQEAVDTPQDRQYFPKMYPNVILCIIWFYTFFGIFCWMSFGNDVPTVMTLALPENNSLAETVQLAYSVAVMLTFPLQNFPSLEIACAAIDSILVDFSASPTVRSNNGLFKIIQMLRRREVTSSLLVCLLALIAKLTMYHLDKVVSLMGGLLGCPLAFVGPPLIHNKLASMAAESEESSGIRSIGYNLSEGRRLRNKIVASLGLVAMIIATIAT